MLKCIDSNNAEFRKYCFLYLEFMFELVKNNDTGIDECVKVYLEEQYQLCSNTSCKKKLHTLNVYVICVVLHSSKLLKQTLMKKRFKVLLMSIKACHSEIK